MKILKAISNLGMDPLVLLDDIDQWLVARMGQHLYNIHQFNEKEEAERLFEIQSDLLFKNPRGDYPDKEWDPTGNPHTAIDTITHPPLKTGPKDGDNKHS